MPSVDPIPVLHREIDDAECHGLIRRSDISCAGNRRLKIYGKLDCASGKRMKRENRVFFHSETDARALGFRPCGHCLPEAYKNWKHGLV